MKNVKETYVSPAVEIVKVSTKDIITVSLPDETINDG